jgi:hypothetical protein
MCAFSLPRCTEIQYATWQLGSRRKLPAQSALAGFQMAALIFAISLDRIFDGFCRPFFGSVPTTSAANTPCSSRSAPPR